MSNRQKQAHTEKVQQRERNFPLLHKGQLEERIKTLSLAHVLFVDELVELQNPYSRVPDSKKAMVGAHLTIAAGTCELLINELGEDLDKLEKQSDIVRITSNLVTPDGKPIA